jgi:crotonobetainyl-CoA:carnitine CoA-transferase CaiB-like acyl-CoA transferase
MTSSPSQPIDGIWAPLRGLRVIDMADEKAELCGRILADLGADVVRVEPPGGAGSRRLGPHAGSDSLYFAVRNANKTNVEIDPTDDAGRQRLLRMLAAGDVWIETTRPGQLAALGLDPRRLSERFPQLIVLSVTDFGQTGPYRDYVATDPVMEGMAWMLFRAGVPELPPVLPPGSLAYDMVGISAAFAALTGYLDRLSTGRGQYIDMGVMEAVAQLTDWGLASYSYVSKMGIYGEIRDGGGKIYPTLPCLDGYVRIAMVTTGEWRKLRAWIGDPPELMEDYWEDQRTRLELFDDLLIPHLIAFCRDKTMMQLADEGQARHIPITPMLSVGDVLAAEQFRELGSFVNGDVAGRRGRYAGGFLVADGNRIGYRTPAPPPPGPDSQPPDWPARGEAGHRAVAPAGRPYDGLRVVEFGVAGAVPEMGRLLAEYGADVIRVESPRRPDLFRFLGGATGGVGTVFASSNRSTRSLGVDYTEPAGAEVVKDLYRGAHVVLENLPAGTLERFGLGSDVIRAVNPSAVLISSQTMGRRGPWAHWRGYGSNTQLPGGLSWLWSFPDVAEPVPQNVAFPDHLVGRLGALTVAAFLVGRLRDAEAVGQVEIVQAEMALNLLADLFLQESIDPGSVRPRGNRSERGVPWGVYQCAHNQRWCVITCRDNNEWNGLVSAMGNPAWALADGLREMTGRRAASDDIDAHLSAWTSTRSDREVMTLLQAHGVPAGMMMYISDQPQDPQLLARGYILEIDQPPLGKLLLEGPAFQASGLPGPITRPAPQFGEHTREICTKLLGYSDATVDELIGKRLLVEPGLDGDPG